MKKASERQEILTIEEVRLVSDLRIMHSKVNELAQIISVLKRHHPEMAIRQYADQKMLDDDIRRVDEIYLWFISLKEEMRIRLARK
ncbi:MAG TPA: hypothetical protein VFT65_01740 [Candidatus Angelobacter sp.]|nr:hypothetical protein [Candidatus Angelobacter sp.]